MKDGPPDTRETGWDDRLTMKWGALLFVVRVWLNIKISPVRH